MDTNRRGFLRFVGSVAAFISGLAAADTVDLRPEIHLGTRNTRLGALGRQWFKKKIHPRFKSYPNAPQIALPAAESTGRTLAEIVRSYSLTRAFASTPLGLADLAALLYFTNGVTAQRGQGSKTLHLRAAPSAGALYSGEIYVIAERIRNLPPGLYYYEVVQHRLIQLRSGSLLAEVGKALEQPDEIENAAAVIALTNIFDRYTGRYASRGYRYGLIDSGHIGENLRLAANSAGLADRSPLRFWDDHINALLEVDGKTEAVCAVHAVGARGVPADRTSSTTRRFSEKQYSVEAIPNNPLIERYHEATKLIPLGDAVKASSTPAAIDVPSSGERKRGIALPNPPSPTTTLETAIRERRSASRFTASPVALRELSFVLTAANGNPALERSAGIKIFAVVHRVTGLEPGVYRYAPGENRLVAVRTGELGSAMRRACLGQEKAATAAVGFVMAAKLEAATSALGDRRYRDLLIESGAIAQRIYLAAEAAGLAARNLAAFIDDSFNELLGLDTQQLSALHLTMLGNGH